MSSFDDPAGASGFAHLFEHLMFMGTERVGQGQFFLSLFLPPLRDRREDTPLLMRHFLEDAAQEYGLEPPVVTTEAMDALLAYNWPGNVRQLRSLCERWVITRSGQRLELDHLPSNLRSSKLGQPTQDSFDIDDTRKLTEVTERLVQQVERTYLQKLLKKHQGHMMATAKAAGITRRTLYTKMKQYGLEAADFRHG